jgi:hypothetical protein
VNTPNNTPIPEPIDLAIREFAQHMGFDEAAVLAGTRFEYKGIGYRLEHHGPVVTDEIVVMVELGEYGWENERSVLRELLLNQRRFPASRMGYYALGEEGRMVFHCVALNIAKPGAFEEIAAVIEATSAGLAATLNQMTCALEQVAQGE